MNLDRRHFITSLAATAGLAAIGGCAGNGASKRTIARVVVIGGGYSGRDRSQISAYVVTGYCGDPCRTQCGIHFMPLE